MLEMSDQVSPNDPAMNRFEFTLRYVMDGVEGESGNSASKRERLHIDAINLHPQLRQIKTSGASLYIIGNPIVGDLRSDGAVVEAYEAAQTVQEFARSLNGSFLICIQYDRTGHVYIVNDRFASVALFYATLDSTLVVSTSLKRIYELLQAQRRNALNQEAVFEFIYFRRLFGEKTLDENAKYMASASIMRIEPGDSWPRLEKYWQPNYQTPSPKGRDLDHAIAECLKRAVRMHMSDERRYALMLSGGIDSRAVLAGVERNPTCITTGLTHNNEVRVAEEVAKTVGAEHHYVPRPRDVYDKVVDDAVFLSGGMQIYVEAEFMGYGEKILPYANTVLTGLGLDILLSGLYLPKSTAIMFGRPALHNVLNPLWDDMTSQFIQKVKYRLWTSDAFSIVKDEYRDRLNDYLRSSVHDIMRAGRALGADGYSLWEYMHTHNLSRHYSFPMMSSIRTFADCRSPAFENDLFDLSISMSARDKVNGTPYQNAIKHLNPDVMAVRNANTNLRAGWPLPVQSWIKAGLYAANKIFNTPYPVSPGWQDRSWPSAYESLQSCPTILDMVHHLPHSQYLSELDFIDMKRIGKIVQEHREGISDHSVLLNLLITIERFIRPDHSCRG